MLPAQTAEDDVAHYINYFRDIAISEMHRTGIPASITLAQGIHESNAGKSRLATKGNNHFGIKCHKGWTGKSMKHTDDAPNECFRTYASPTESYIDHSEFLMHRDRYNNCFNFDITDYVNWAKELKKAGYATNPIYAEKLIETIEKNYLYIYDKSDWAEMLAVIEMNKKLSRGEDVLAAAPQITSTHYNNNSYATQNEYTLNSNNSTNSVKTQQSSPNGLAPGEYIVREYTPYTSANTPTPVNTSTEFTQSNTAVGFTQKQSELKTPAQILKENPTENTTIDATTLVMEKPELQIVKEKTIVEYKPAKTNTNPSITKKEEIQVIAKTVIPKTENTFTREVVEVKQELKPTVTALMIKPTSHITYFNRRKVVMYNYGVTPADVTGDYDVRVKQLAKFNEIDRDEYIEANTKIYLQPKRKKGPWGKPYHKVEPGETIFDIAQNYGIKTKKLRKLNLMLGNQEPIIGEVVYLRKKRDYPPKTNDNGSNFDESYTYNKGTDILNGIKKFFNE